MGTLYLTYLRRNLFANLKWYASSARHHVVNVIEGPKKKPCRLVKKYAEDVPGSWTNKLSTLDIYISPFGRVYKHLLRMFFRFLIFIFDIYLH